LVSNCPHERFTVRVASKLGAVDLCLSCGRVRPLAGEWRQRHRGDGIEERWVREMRVAVGLKEGEAP
jgi:hypothetical protein